MSDNKEKMEHGKKGIESVYQMLNALKSKDYIVRIEHPYWLSDPKYGEDQFYFQFLVEFNDSTQWILHHTTSYKDRIAIQQWHSEHIKRLNRLVEKAYVILPDTLEGDDRIRAENYNKKIVEKKIYSALDGVIFFDDAYHRIEHKAASLMNAGSAKAKLGLHFEDKLVACLKNRENLERLKNHSSLEVGYLYSLYKDVVSALNINSQDILSVDATSNIPKLPSGGSPKTDVLVIIETINGKVDFAISCKRSSADSVTVHEYTADAFASVLNPADKELRDLLIDFQTVGGVRSMESVKAEQLRQKLSGYNDKLCKWVLAGIGGEGKPHLQWADYIIVVDDRTNQYSIQTIDGYISMLKKEATGQLGTPFSWTYPSGGKGKRIQLKCKML